jgi:hypothetical protein
MGVNLGKKAQARLQKMGVETQLGVADDDSDRVTCRDLAYDFRHGQLAPGSMIGQRSDRTIRTADRSTSNLLPQTVIRTNNLARALVRTWFPSFSGTLRLA